MTQAWPQNAERNDCPVAYSNRLYNNSDTSSKYATKEKPFVTKRKQQAILRIFKPLFV
jgi:hypothetical protein